MMVSSVAPCEPFSHMRRGSSQTWTSTQFSLVSCSQWAACARWCRMRPEWMMSTASAVPLPYLRTPILQWKTAAARSHMHAPAVLPISNHALFTIMHPIWDCIYANDQFKKTFPSLASHRKTHRNQKLKEWYLHFFSVNWWSKHDFPTPMSPDKKRRETLNAHRSIIAMRHTIQYSLWAKAESWEKLSS